MEKLMKSFYNTLKDVSRLRGNDFSGLGLVLYEESVLPSTYHDDLRPSIKCPDDIILGNSGTVNFLLTISDKTHPLHDGFHFFNEKGRLVHVSQYFVPPIREGIVPNESYGTRYRSAQYGSFLDGVILIGTVNHDESFFCFRKGQIYFPHEQLK